MNTLTNSFRIPSYLNATVPAEMIRGYRDDVRLLVLDSESGNTTHARFCELGNFLKKGDLLLFNNSRTIPAVLEGEKIKIHLSRKREDETWEGLVIYEGEDKGAENSFLLQGNLTGRIIGNGSEHPLKIISFSMEGEAFINHLYTYGAPIRYEYIQSQWSLDAYQTVFASVPGSVEMPSAGRAFSWRLLEQLKAQGINFAFLSLHTGLSYYGEDQWPNPTKHPESFEIPLETEKLVNETKKRGGRVIAVGTTVVRAIESARHVGDEIQAGKGLTTLYINEGYDLNVVDGLLTGFHEPEASHLHLLTSLIKEKQLMASYQEALSQGYLWHEFGDVNLIISQSVPK
ncbi:S-adenosylmethionine:tRNA ribosyltransferase-isomerase [Bacillus sp. 2205SS5-2]|uniref:S-adenosylmethionine:tRNA ribosyltransferase-isomerase n=1 Tax=Bacillus sp. 2205SS5-2 TaxID=3109031 RepID=UPI00300614E7